MDQNDILNFCSAINIIGTEIVTFSRLTNNPQSSKESN